MIKKIVVNTQHVLPTGTKPSAILVKVNGGKQKTVPYPYSADNPHREAIYLALGPVLGIVYKKDLKFGFSYDVEVLD